MTGRIDSRRETVRSRRKTLRQSTLEAKRGSEAVSGGSSGEQPSRLPTRPVTRNLAAKAATAQAVEEKKTRRGITMREVQKARPPFNQYARVKHTGLSPFKSFQGTQKKTKVAPWRAPPPKPPSVNFSSQARNKTLALAPSGQSTAPGITMASGVIQFPILPHMHHAKITFRAPAKVQPVPLALMPTKGVKPAKKQSTEETTKPPQRPMRAMPSRAIKQEPTASTQTKPKSAPLTKTKVVLIREKPAKKPPPAPKPVPPKSVKPTESAPPPKRVAQIAKPASRLGRRTEVPARKTRRPLSEKSTKEANQDNEPLATKIDAVATKMEPLATKMEPLATKMEPLATKIDAVATKMEPRATKMHAVAAKIEPPTRVLRSSSRLQQRGKENISPANPALDVPLVQNDQSAIPQSTSIINSVADERIKSLDERKDKLMKETDRLRSMADEWVGVKSFSQLAQNVVDEIDSVTGQTYLLITKKFIQYKGLIEGAYGNPTTTIDDLDGFWDMMFIQVDQLDNKYRKLEEMKNRNWATHSPTPVKKAVKKSAKPSKRPPPKTNFRKFLAEKKKEMEATTESTSEDGNGEHSRDAAESQILSPGLNMSVDQVISSPVRSVLSSLRNSCTPRLRTPARKSTQRAKTPASMMNSPLQVSFRVTDSPLNSSVEMTPRALENARRASRSIRLSSAMMRVSLNVANELDCSTADP